MAAAPLGTYEYNYGIGELNRRIEFVRQDGQDPSTIEAKVYVLVDGVAQDLISRVSGADISIQRASTTEKSNAMRASREGQPYTLGEDTTLDQCDDAEQQSICDALSSRTWSITPRINPGRYFENVVALKIFNPN